ncbi:hypothetical protein MU0083_000763 [[Mycobacterium] kokjensenii]|uniref:Peptidoglycan-binding protein ArfA BON-like domain-containing protein n=1 Tax=[Mycobacterium] kokjensenii TaxID=3064287 RepID=A0ABM9L7U1_9MYCO|nr:hypothetical protein [Mycolicibacter sp. MU0083]CAJ1494311.1 hypothetical protein MU0083_000763 [Mycolicibacter sp. MU0083]
MRARLIGAALAVLLGAAGCGMPERPAPTGPEPAAATPVPVSVVRHGTEIVLAGEVADPAARRALLDAVITSSEDITVVDTVGVSLMASAPDFTAAAPVFEAAAGIADFTLHAGDDVVTLGGTVTKPDEAAIVVAAGEDAWPRARIVDEFVVGS